MVDADDLKLKTRLRRHLRAQTDIFTSFRIFDVHNRKPRDVRRHACASREFEMTNTDWQRRINLESDLAELCVRGAVGATEVIRLLDCEAEIVPGCDRTADDDRLDASQEW
ncbi:MAG: hypothetical protein ACO3CG_04335 [Ilumatobacteraceae bacterium]